jgi:hypothetical protein
LVIVGIEEAALVAIEPGGIVGTEGSESAREAQSMLAKGRGVGALCAVNTLSYFIPLSVGFNLFTIAFSSLFSVPGVILLLISDVWLF